MSVGEVWGEGTIPRRDGNVASAHQRIPPPRTQRRTEQEPAQSSGHAAHSTAEWLALWDTGDRVEAARLLQECVRAPLAYAANRYRQDASEIEGEFNDRTYGADMRALRGQVGADPLASVVRRVVHNCASKLARGQRRAHDGLRRLALDRRVGHAAPCPDPGGAAETRDLADACERALLQLPGPHASVLRAQADDLTKRQMRQLLARPDGRPASLDRVSQALRMARRMARDALDGVDIRHRYRQAFAPVTQNFPD